MYPLSEKFPYNSTYAIQENKMGLGVELEGMELLKNHTGYFAIRGNEMVVKQSPLTQRDSYGRPSFKAGDIGLSINGYHPDHSRITSGHTGLKLDIYKYTGPTVSSVQMQDTTDKISNKERQVFTTTKTGSEMWNLKQVALDRAIAKTEGVREIVGLVNLGINIPYAIKSTINYARAVDDISEIKTQAIYMDRAIKFVNQSGIKMNDQLRNDTINYIFDGTLHSPEKGLMPNSLIIQHGTKIMNANGIQVQSLNEQLKINNKIPK